MIIVDTNVLSEPMKPKPERSVVEWLNRQDRATLYLATPSLAELLFGIEILPDGKRKDEFRSALKDLLRHFFGTRLLSFDSDAAETFAVCAARARTKGLSISIADGQIAAIAAARDFIVATRDTRPFMAAGLQIINPWKV